VSFRTDPYFGFAVPSSVPGIEPHLLYPMKTWKDKAAFDQTARKLVRMFQENFVKYEKHVDADVRSAAPEVRLAAEWFRRSNSAAATNSARSRESGNPGATGSPLSRGRTEDASALRGAEPIETLLLLVAQRSVKLLERGLDGLHRAQHRIEPLLHRLQAADR